MREGCTNNQEQINMEKSVVRLKRLSTKMDSCDKHF